jgi:Zn-dependent protease with chaperone function
MNFFAQQQQARNQTRLMLVLFAAAVVAVVASIDFVIWLALVHSVTPAEMHSVLVFSSCVILTVIGIASLYKTLTLREGGGVIARALGGVRVNHDNTDAGYRRLTNVVEEMAIAAGVVCPEIYVLEQEAAINAFAAGFSSADAAVAVTRGALEKLSRDELQGVIAHEFSHILNGDMRLNIRLLGVLFGLMVIGIIGREVMLNTRGGKDEMPVLLIGLVTMALGYLGLSLGRLIKASISRSREYNADATAVQFTRMSSGISGALKKVGGFHSGSKLTHKKTESVEHMLFADGQGFAQLLATHPDLAQRITRLDPSFRADQLQKLKELEANQASAPNFVDEPISAAQLLGFAVSAPARATNASALPPSYTPQSAVKQVVAQVASPEVIHVDYARALRRSVAPLLTQAAHSRSAAASLILGLALSAEPDAQSAQLALIENLLGNARLASVNALLPALMELKREHKLPLACIAFPTLKLSTAAELAPLRAGLNAIVNLDGALDFFEYCLVKLVQHYLDDANTPARAALIGRAKLQDFTSQLSCVFSTLAQQGHANIVDAQAAFAAGTAGLNAAVKLEFAPTQDYTTQDYTGAFDAALTALDTLAPFAKRQLLTGLVTTLNYDGKIAVAEAELLRVICLSLHCPLPPLLAALSEAATNSAIELSA